MNKIYDFYENFPKIYPIEKEDLLNPEREKWGYFWDLEDYMINSKKSYGINLRGFLITCKKDLDFFCKIFEENLKKTLINAQIKSKNVIFDREFIKNNEVEEVFINGIVSDTISDFDDKIKEIINNKDLFISHIEEDLKKYKIWIPVNKIWDYSTERATVIFWEKDVKVMRLPDEYVIMNDKELWEESMKETSDKNLYDFAWENLSYNFPHLIKYMDPYIVEKVKVTFLKDCDSFGIF